MNYAKILRADIANGEGFRVTLFVSGCDRNCPGCFNKIAQDPNYGKVFDEEAKNKIFEELKHPWCKGLSLLGGEPLSHLSDNRKQVIEFAKEVKEKFPEKSIFMWSGYTFEEIISSDDMKDITKYVDVLIDGPFEEKKKNLGLKWKGSSNQRLVDVVEFRKSGLIKECVFNK